MLAELLLVAVATAAPVVTWPDTAVTVTPCSADPAAACWQRADVLGRFAPVPGTFGDVVEADVRLAWVDEDLLVRVSGLPSESRLEVGVQDDPQGGRDAPEISLIAAGPSPFVVRVATTRPLRPGQIRGLRLSVQIGTPTTPAAEVLPWAPSGDGDLDRAASMLVVRRPTLVQPPTVDVAGDQLTIEAPGASSVSLTAVREIEPGWSIGIEPPWSIQGDDGAVVARPRDEGWYELDATWRDERGQPRAVGRWRLWLTAQPVSGLSAMGIHPAPDVQVPLEEAGFTFAATTRIAVAEPAWRGTARLMADELERTLGRRPEIVSRARQGDIWIGPATRTPPRRLRPRGGVLLEAEPGGFSLALSERGVVIEASTHAAATFGALAVVDALGLDGRVTALVASDAPDVPMRVYYAELMARGKSPIDLDAYRDNLRRGVARGRYEYVVLEFKSGVVLDSHPELARPNAMSKDDARGLIDSLRELGITPLPGGNEPGHAQWLSAKHPEIKEDGQDAQLCTRNPDTWRLVAEVYGELLDLFSDESGPPQYFHVGHDEVRFHTERVHEDARCPRCQGTPRWELWAESLEWHVAWLASHGVETMAWSDMLSNEWYEGMDDIWRAAELLSPDTRKHLLLLSWANVGDPVSQLIGQGFTVGRVHAGYRDWKRDGLAEAVELGIVAEGMSQYGAYPTSNISASMSSQTLRNAWPTTILAGTTGWRVGLSTTAIDPGLSQARDLLAYRPGVRHVRGWSGQTAPLEVTGDSWHGPSVAPPLQIEVAGVSFAPTVQAGTKGRPARAEVGRRVAGVSLLEATALNQQAHRIHAQHVRQAPVISDVAVARVVVTWADGEQQAFPWRLGVHTQRPDFGPRAAILWAAAGSVPVPAFQGGPDERWVARWDWLNPRPDVVVEHIEIEPLVGGGQVLVLGASALLPGI